MKTYKMNWHRETGNTGINTREIKRHLEWVETITRTGETDQGVTASAFINFCVVILKYISRLAQREMLMLSIVYSR